MSGKALVLMSTYNGDKYLRDQLNSLVSQTVKDFYLVVRDDGSTDNTVKIILEYFDKGLLKGELIRGENIGACRSYLELLWYIKDREFAYLFFADQDDVWKDEKIERAIMCMEENHADLYCGKQLVVDNALKEVGTKIYPGIKVRPGFGNALIENIAPGCTMAVSRKLVEIIISAGKPENIFMHDWWIYLWACACGTVYYDDEQYVLYRQDRNMLGSPNSRLDRIKRRIRNYRVMKKAVLTQVDEFVHRYPHDNDKLLLARRMARRDLEDKKYLIFSNEIYRQIRIDTLLYKLLLVFW